MSQTSSQSVLHVMYHGYFHAFQEVRDLGVAEEQEFRGFPDPAQRHQGFG